MVSCISLGRILLTARQAVNIEDAYKHLVFLGYVVSIEEDASGHTA